MLRNLKTFKLYLCIRCWQSKSWQALLIPCQSKLVLYKRTHRKKSRNKTSILKRWLKVWSKTRSTSRYGRATSCSQASTPTSRRSSRCNSSTRAVPRADHGQLRLPQLTQIDQRRNSRGRGIIQKWDRYCKRIVNRLSHMIIHWIMRITAIMRARQTFRTTPLCLKCIPRRAIRMRGTAHQGDLSPMSTSSDRRV